MAFASALFTYALLIVGVVAAPSSVERYTRRVAARGVDRHLSKPMVKIVKTAEIAANTTHDSFSGNWAGAVLSEGRGTWTSVTGTITVPVPSLSSASGNPQSASAWVGIDGDTCGSAILQTGIDVTVNSNGARSYDAWWEWFPAGASDLTGLAINAGDTLTFTVTATSASSGTARIDNHSTGVSALVSASGEPSLCQQDAEWIVEDYEVGSGQVPFADFGTVSFTGASASGSVGTVGPSGSTVIDMVLNNQVVTSTSVGGSSVTISYV